MSEDMIEQFKHYAATSGVGTGFAVTALNWETASAAIALGFLGALGGLIAGFFWRKVFPKRKV